MASSSTKRSINLRSEAGTDLTLSKSEDGEGLWLEIEGEPWLIPVGEVEILISAIGEVVDGE